MTYTITILSLIAAILAWVAKIRWSNEYKEATNRNIEAKDAQIEVLEKQIDHLNGLNPKKLYEWYQAGLAMAEEYAIKLENQVESANNQISELKKEGKKTNNELDKITAESATLKKLATEMRNNAAHGILPDSTTIATSGSSSQALADSTSIAPPPAITIYEHFLKVPRPKYSFIHEDEDNEQSD